ncbi:unnamed protein product [Linum tenue]|uniref:Uncharacterized protein n=1 Tax=Linum tenue TaxID=586396 RepID=A0AAV0KIS0_9ROSI|nr:unnamed protein product [Linum tenue]
MKGRRKHFGNWRCLRWRCHDLTLDRAALALNSVRALGSLSLNSLESKEQELKTKDWENSLVCITLKNDGMSYK